VELGLASMLDPEGERDPAVMATALRKLPDQKPPSAHQIPGLLDGQERIAELIRRRLEEPYIDGSLTA
jgi:predicted glycosyltransferase